MSNNYARADSCLKEFIFRGVSFNENDADFMRRSSSDSDSTTVVDQSELRRNNTGSSLGFSTFFEHPMDKPYDFGRMPSGTSDRCSSISSSISSNKRERVDTSSTDSSGIDAKLNRIVSADSASSYSPVSAGMAQFAHLSSLSSAPSNGSSPRSPMSPPSKQMRCSSEESSN